MIGEFPREGDIYLGEAGIVKLSNLSQVCRRVEICLARPRKYDKMDKEQKTTSRENGIICAVKGKVE